jgi:hypothetical protein
MSRYEPLRALRGLFCLILPREDGRIDKAILMPHSYLLEYP